MKERWQAPVEVPTLRELRRGTTWFWLDCQHCKARRPVLLVHLMLALGVDASSDRVRSQARCRRCGKQGAATYHPSWVDSQTGFQAFPGYGANGEWARREISVPRWNDATKSEE